MSDFNEQTADNVKPSELKTMLMSMIPEGMPVLIKGSPGIGKSDLIKQCVEELDRIDRENGGEGYDFLKSEPFLKNPIHYTGLPGIVDGQAEFLPFSDLRLFLNATKPLVVFVDDLGWAANSVQQAVAHLILAREINGEKISDHVRFVAATNRKEDKAGVMSILEPVKSRFLSILQLVVDWEEWVYNWSLDNGVPDILRAFIRTRPDLLDKFEATSDVVNTPSPRTVAHVGKILKMGMPDSLELKSIAGAAGTGFAYEFIGFKNTWHALPDFDKAIHDPDSITIDTEDMSAMYATAIGMASRVKVEYESDDPEWRIRNFITILDKMPKEFAIVGMHDLYNRMPEIINTTVFEQDWAPKYADTFRPD